MGEGGKGDGSHAGTRVLLPHGLARAVEQGQRAVVAAAQDAALARRKRRDTGPERGLPPHGHARGSEGGQRRGRGNGLRLPREAAHKGGGLLRRERPGVGHGAGGAGHEQARGREQGKPRIQLQAIELRGADGHNSRRVARHGPGVRGDGPQRAPRAGVAATNVAEIGEGEGVALAEAGDLGLREDLRDLVGVGVVGVVAVPSAVAVVERLPELERGAIGVDDAEVLLGLVDGAHLGLHHLLGLDDERRTLVGREHDAVEPHAGGLAQGDGEAMLAGFRDRHGGAWRGLLVRAFALAVAADGRVVGEPCTAVHLEPQRVGARAGAARDEVHAVGARLEAPLERHRGLLREELHHAASAVVDHLHVVVADAVEAALADVERAAIERGLAEGAPHAAYDIVARSPGTEPVDHDEEVVRLPEDAAGPVEAVGVIEARLGECGVARAGGCEQFGGERLRGDHLGATFAGGPLVGAEAVADHDDAVVVLGRGADVVHIHQPGAAAGRVADDGVGVQVLVVAHVEAVEHHVLGVGLPTAAEHGLVERAARRHPLDAVALDAGGVDGEDAEADVAGGFLGLDVCGIGPHAGGAPARAVEEPLASWVAVEGGGACEECAGARAEGAPGVAVGGLVAQAVVRGDAVVEARRERACGEVAAQAAGGEHVVDGVIGDRPLVVGGVLERLVAGDLAGEQVLDDGEPEVGGGHVAAGLEVGGGVCDAACGIGLVVPHQAALAPPVEADGVAHLPEDHGVLDHLTEPLGGLEARGGGHARAVVHLVKGHRDCVQNEGRRLLLALGVVGGEHLDEAGGQAAVAVVARQVEGCRGADEAAAGGPEPIAVEGPEPRPSRRDLCLDIRVGERLRTRHRRTGPLDGERDGDASRGLQPGEERVGGRTHGLGRAAAHEEDVGARVERERDGAQLVAAGARVGGVGADEVVGVEPHRQRPGGGVAEDHERRSARGLLHGVGLGHRGQAHARGLLEACDQVLRSAGVVGGLGHEHHGLRLAVGHEHRVARGREWRGERLRLLRRHARAQRGRHEHESHQNGCS